MAFVKFPATTVFLACERAIASSQSKEQTDRIRRLQDLAFAAAGADTAVYLSAEDFADVKSGWVGLPKA